MVTIALEDGEETTLTGAGGVFVFGGVPVGSQLLTVRQYGYSPLAVTAVVSAGPPDLLEIPLPPSAFILEGFSVVADNLATINQRLQSRRRAAAVMTRAYDQERLWRTAARDMTEFLGFEASLWPSTCSAGSCIVRRGRLYSPRVYIDEVTAFGGLDELETYRPQDFYLLEVYSSGGEIRAYTHQFMERMARRPMALIPIGLWR